MEKRYPALQTISVLLKILAIIVIVIGIFSLFSIISIGQLQIPSRLSQFLGTFLLSFGIMPTILLTSVSSLFLWGSSELLICFMDIEYNTREEFTTPSESEATINLNQESQPKVINNSQFMSDEKTEELDPNLEYIAEGEILTGRYKGQIVTSQIVENEEITKEPTEIKKSSQPQKSIWNKKLW